MAFALLHFLTFLLVTTSWSSVFCAPTFETSSKPRPLVIWHGLGDSYASPGMLEFIQMIKEVHPDIFVHSIHIQENIEEDQKAGWFGNVNEQIEFVSQQLANTTELKDGFDALGFSQGGQFLRAYVERYNSPPVHNLITFGSQHMGVSDIPLCRPWDLFCQLARRAARGGVYTEYAQTNLVQAQYFRDPDRLSNYLASNKFLASINNEVDDALNGTYGDNLVSLNKLVLVLFAEDKTVVPKESSWFGSYAPTDDDDVKFPWQDKAIIPMRLQPIYLDDRIGLKTLDERGDVVLESCEGEHMQVTRDCWEPIVKRFVGGPVEDISIFDIPQTVMHA
ncbi:hypothetical protein QCA50_004535 [Cerrena zonata]|uniref:Palmitoyl-protein thioesterase 1 n=1 Tax=Cerrena zonata TaxID=2478898 RepID=A0AAW0GPA7_9APHY